MPPAGSRPRPPASGKTTLAAFLAEVGNTYTLHHSMIHSVTAAPYTTSLIVRGPAVRDRLLVTDRVTGQAWWQYGAATEDPAEAARKRMSCEQFHDCLDRLIEVGVLPCAPQAASARPRRS